MKNENFSEDIKNQIDTSKYLEEYTYKADVVEGQINVDEFICCICTRIAYKPVECKECEKHMC